MASIDVRRLALLSSCLVGSLCLHTVAVAQSFSMRLDSARTYTPFFPNGFIDTTPPYTICHNNQMGLTFRYSWRNAWEEYVYTEPGQQLFPWYFMQGVSPNPLYLRASQGGNTVSGTVLVGLFTGSVNTVGVRQVSFRGRTSGFFGQPVQTATANIQIETQFEPPPMTYRELGDGVNDMPTRPWFGWVSSQQIDSHRLDAGKCTDASAVEPEECGSTSYPIVTYEDCDPDDPNYCWIGTESEHRTLTALDPSTPYQYRVLGRNTCGISNELLSTPARRFFRTAQACFLISNGTIPDGGVVHFDAATLSGNPGSTVPDLRVTVHADHADVSDLRISLTKTAPDAAGPLLLMDRPSATGCVNGTRIQAAFADGGNLLASGCNPWEPAISGRKAPVQALASFANVQGAGNWRLTVEDTEADGKSGVLLEWCLSTIPNVPQLQLQPAPFLPPTIFDSGFE